MESEANTMCNLGEGYAAENILEIIGIDLSDVNTILKFCPKYKCMNLLNFKTLYL